MKRIWKRTWCLNSFNTVINGLRNSIDIIIFSGIILLMTILPQKDVMELYKKNRWNRKTSYWTSRDSMTILRNGSYTIWLSKTHLHPQYILSIDFETKYLKVLSIIFILSLYHTLCWECRLQRYMIYHQITWTSSQTGSQQYYCRSNVYFIIPAWFLFDYSLDKILHLVLNAQKK